MSNRWLRFGIALLALGAAAAAGYRVFEQEQRLDTDVISTRVVDAAAETALGTVSELKAALHAYLSEGQGNAFWTARAALLIDRLRASILELDARASAAGVAVTDTLDLVDRLAAAEQRAREHVRAGQRLLAGEMIFIEARDLLDAIRSHVAGARSAIAQSAEAAQTQIRRQQAILLLGAAGILAFATLLLVIPGGSASPATTRAELVAAEPTVSSATGRRMIESSSPPPSPQADEPPLPSLREAAAVCTDLGRVSQSIEISGLLGRAAHVLNASGVVVWMASADGNELHAAASAGYDARLLARIGSIPRTAANVTAGSLRDAAARTSPALGPSAAALAIPLMTPLGPVGVLSAEIRDVADVDEARMAIATIFAAQLALLLGSMAPATPADVPQEAVPQPAKAQA